MPEFADIWSHFSWRFLPTIFKPVIKHSRITMQKKAITIGKPHYRPQICNWSQREASKKKEPVYWTYCCSIYRLYLGFAIIQTRGRRDCSFVFVMLYRSFFDAFSRVVCGFTWFFSWMEVIWESFSLSHLLRLQLLHPPIQLSLSSFAPRLWQTQNRTRSPLLFVL